MLRMSRGADHAARSAEIAAEAVLGVGDHPTELVAMEGEAATGCSICARALVNLHETAADLALTGGGHPPRASLRDRILEDARRQRPTAGGRAGAAEAPLEAVGGPPVDPATHVGRLHGLAAEEARRIEEIDELSPLGPREAVACERILAQVHRAISFPVLFVGIVRGPVVENRIRHGLPPELDEVLRLVPREETFCTHCVSADGPLVVESAGQEPFFRGGPIVTRFGVRAYLGVPLRTARGITVGTLCALDVAPHRVGPSDVSLLSVFAVPVVAELERYRTPDLRDALLDASQPGHEVYQPSWFSDLLAVELARTRGGRPASLIGVVGASARDVGAAAETAEVAGRLGPDAVGLLLSGTDDATAAHRADKLRHDLPGARVCLAAAMPGEDAARWRARALGR